MLYCMVPSQTGGIYMPYLDNEAHKKQRREYARRNPYKIRLWLKRSRENARARMWARYGERCVLCGYNDKRALELDHVFGRPKAEQGRGKSYAALKRALDAPDGEFRILCRNCNWIAYLERTSTVSTGPVLSTTGG